MSNKLIIKQARVLFSSFKDEGNGRNITIDVTDKDLQKQITEWTVENNVGLITAGKYENSKTYGGDPNFKEYTNDDGVKTIQYTLKLSKDRDPSIKDADRNDVSSSEIRYGAEIGIVAKAFEYNNKFGKGISSSISAIKLISTSDASSGEQDLELLMDE